MDGTKYKTYRLPYVYVVDVSFYWVIFGRHFFLKFILSQLHRALCPEPTGNHSCLWLPLGSAKADTSSQSGGQKERVPYICKTSWQVCLAQPQWVLVTSHKGSLL